MRYILIPNPFSLDAYCPASVVFQVSLLTLYHTVYSFVTCIVFLFLFLFPFLSFPFLLVRVDSVNSFSLLFNILLYEHNLFLSFYFDESCLNFFFGANHGAVNPFICFSVQRHSRFPGSIPVHGIEGVWSMPTFILF